MKPSDAIAQREKNRAAFGRLKDTIDRTFPPGRFVAIHDNKIAADAPSFEELLNALRAKELDPADTLVIQASVAYPETGVILIQGVIP